MQDIVSVSLHNESGLLVELIDFGARIVDVKLPHAGNLVSLSCHYDSLSDYQHDPFYLGASIGPIANRIRLGQFSIDGRAVQLPINHGEHCLHSGQLGFDRHYWQVAEQASERVTFSLIAEPVEGSLPGQLCATATYWLAGLSLWVEYKVLSDAPTFVNLTNHAYWNLNTDKSSIQNHQFELYTEGFAVKDSDGIPSGQRQDLRSPFHYSLLDELDELDKTAAPELQHQIDHHFFAAESRSRMHTLAQATSPESGISLTVRSSKPGFQFYSGHFLEAPFTPFDGFCIEPQYVPNAINLPEFESPLLTAESPYRHIIEYAFETP